MEIDEKEEEVKNAQWKLWLVRQMWENGLVWAVRCAPICVLLRSLFPFLYSSTSFFSLFSTSHYFFSIISCIQLYPHLQRLRLPSLRVDRSPYAPWNPVCLNAGKKKTKTLQYRLILFSQAYSLNIILCNTVWHEIVRCMICFPVGAVFFTEHVDISCWSLL